MSVVALSELLGASVRDASGAVRGRVREIAVAPQDHPTRIAFLIVKTPDGERALAPAAITSAGASVRAGTDASQWERFSPSDGVKRSHWEMSVPARTVAPADVMAPGTSARSPSAVLTIRNAMRVG